MTDITRVGPACLTTFYSGETWIEGRAEDQLAQVARWPGLSAVAGFPDLHPGRHGPVGAAFLADRLYPQLIGPDIGCGMALYRLDVARRKLRLDKAARRLRVLEDGLDPQVAGAALDAAGITGLTPHGLGTIGGGNHFCEVQCVEQVTDPSLGLAKGDLCLLVHSGSRSAGAGIFARIEATWAEGFAADSAEGSAYLALHDAAVAWAALNRDWIARRAAEALRTEAHLICDAIHNHIRPHPGGWLHRKGAAEPDRGLAPLAGSREALSYLLTSRNAPAEALGSLSHGSGRRHDRSAMHGRIRRTKSALQAMTRTRFGGHVVCEDRDLLIEEAGQAYKDPGQVVRDLERFGIAREGAALAPLLTFKTVREGRP